MIAILLQRLQSMALLKAHDPLHRVAWLSANRAANNTVKIAAPLNPSNLHQDLIAFARLQRIIGLVCLLIVSTLGVVIAIVQSHREGNRRRRTRLQR